MPIRVNITQPVSLPGGLAATAQINAPSTTIDLILQASAFSITTSVNAPTTIISEPGLVLPPAQVLTTSINAPTVRISTTAQATALQLTTAIVDPMAGVSITPSAFSLTTTLNAPEVGGDVTIQPPAFALQTELVPPTPTGDLLYSVIDPPWNVIGIRLILNMDYADVERDDLPSMVGTLLYQWHNGLYNGQDFNWTGGQIVERLDGNTVDPDQIFNVLYTVIQQNPGTSLGSDIIVLNLNEDFEVDCQDTDMDETSELLAALLGRQGIKRPVGSDLCGADELVTALCGDDALTTVLCGSEGYE